jgi:hypothetical protein
MRYVLKVEDKVAQFEGIGKFPLSELIVEMPDYGMVRGDALLTMFLHGARQREYKSCLGNQCEVCEADRLDNIVL